MTPARATLEVVLPSGIRVKLREPTGADELAVQLEAGGGPDAPLLREWGLVMRAIVEVDGERFDQSSVTSRTFRDQWGAKDWMMLRASFAELYLPSEAEERAVQASKRLGVH